MLLQKVESSLTYQPQSTKQHRFAKLPIPKLNAKNQKIASEIVNIVDKILKLKANDSQSDTTTLESKIDNLVYQLYELDSHEIKIIESK